ncbi:WAP four-disulfide core domain protein 6B-like [Eleutherodactylus coqui]|uniref:WAP four-disulfide core domain protein 6B-like n=1 Tax=Eleutherodactylus coqui TaxID=57060 RepID=UPI0034619C86
MILQKDSTNKVNVFRTEKDCLRTCTQTYSSLYPEGDAVCNLTKDSGPCMALALMWYYDMEQKVCDSFFYGGCQGNGNRFNDKEECIDRCVPAKKGKSGAAQEAERSGEGVDTGLIIGVVFGVIFGAAFLVTLGLYLVQRKKMKQQKHTRVPDAEMK